MRHDWEKLSYFNGEKFFAQKFRGRSTLYTLKNKNVVKSSFFVLFVRRFIQRTQKVYVFSFFLHFYWCICVGLGSDKWVRPFYHYTDRKPVFNMIDARQVGITHGIHIKIRRQLGMWYAFFVSMKVRKNYFRPLAYTFRLLSGGEIQHRYAFWIPSIGSSFFS